MRKILRQVFRSQKGQALPIVLALMMVGGLAIPPALDYAATGLKSTKTVSTNVKAIYAAEAGVENVIWSEKYSQPLPVELTEDINRMHVTMQTVNEGTYTIYLGELVPATVHVDWLILSGEVVWDAVRGAYKYTITITWQPYPGTPKISLNEVGARLPDEHSYQAGSAALFGGTNLSTAEPTITQDVDEAYMVKWNFSSPFPSVSQSNPVATQSFYLDGTAVPDGEYAWAVAVRSDVGTVGEIVGTLYKITSTATDTQSGAVTARITADILEAEKTYVITWQISK